MPQGGSGEQKPQEAEASKDRLRTSVEWLSVVSLGVRAGRMVSCGQRQGPDKVGQRGSWEVTRCWLGLGDSYVSGDSQGVGNQTMEAKTLENPTADFRDEGKGKPLVVNGNLCPRKWKWKKPAF